MKNIKKHQKGAFFLYIYYGEVARKPLLKNILKKYDIIRLNRHINSNLLRSLIYEKFKQRDKYSFFMM